MFKINPNALRTENFLSGLMFAAVGGIGLFFSLQHSLGTAARMGPGYFPSMVSGALLLVGIVIIARALIVISPLFEPIAFRPFIFIITSTIIFGLALERMGFAISVALLMFVSRLSENQINIKETLLLTLTVCAISIAIFSYGLGLPFRIFPP